MKRLSDSKTAALMAAYLAMAALLVATGAWWFTQAITYWIPQSGMSPVILAGDRLFAWRNYYRNRAPARGDIAVYVLPADRPTVFVKRVVGLPGDRVQVKDGRLHINGAPVPRERLGLREVALSSGGSIQITEYRETLPSGRQYLIWEAGDAEPADNTPEYLVPPGHTFFLGDNRDHSLDSRFSDRVGFIPLEYLRDRPAFVYWSTDHQRIGVAVQPPP